MKSILVLDDNKHILDALSENLSRYMKNCNIMTASNGKKGAHILSSTVVDLVLTDVDMPEEDGLLFIENTRKAYPGVPLCVMTGNCGPQVLERLRALGVERLIQKPFLFDSLADVIRKELQMEVDTA